MGRAEYSSIYGPRAVVTIEIDEAYWHRGLAEVMLASLCVAAARAGISTFLLRADAADMRLIALLGEQFAARASRDGSHVDVEFATSV